MHMIIVTGLYLGFEIAGTFMRAGGRGQDNPNTLLFTSNVSK